MKSISSFELFLTVIPLIAFSGCAHSAGNIVSGEGGASVALESDARAQKIAEASAVVQKNYALLKEKANEITDPEMRKAAVEILNQPRFSVVDARRGREAKIIKELVAKKLFAPKINANQIFPTHSALPFIAAPGSFWSQHHTYPGGLVFHTLTNLEIALGIEKSWDVVYGTGKLDGDLLRLAVIWHDSAKALLDHWNKDGTVNTSEGDKIAGTGAHHIWGIAEAVYRGMDPRFVVVLASAHSPATPGTEKSDLLNYLHAAAIIAGKPLSAAGLNADASDLLSPPPLESFVNHLSDHDYVAAEVSLDVVRQQLEQIMQSQKGGVNHWKEDQVFAQYGDLYLYQLYLKKGKPALEAILKDLK